MREVGESPGRGNREHIFQMKQFLKTFQDYVMTCWLTELYIKMLDTSVRSKIMKLDETTQKSVYFSMH